MPITGGYDGWKQDADAAPDPGHGRATTYALTCATCTWAVTGLRLDRLTPLAIVHQATTGHVILFRGVAQEFGDDKKIARPSLGATTSAR